MLRTTKSMKDKYEKIQNYIFSLIPEKWEEIYLYASVSQTKNRSGTGELFFYYLPKGIIKRRLINAYEVPKRFNINEEQYLKVVEELYKCIKSLRQEFVDTEQEVWNSLTISIASLKFKVDFDYEDLPKNDREVYERNIIWKYKYLKLDGENREERKILENYYSKIRQEKTQTYETGIYVRTDNNIVGFDKEQSEPAEFIMYEKDDLLNIKNNIKNNIRNKIKGNQIFEKNDRKEIVEENEEQDKEPKRSRNQILDS